MLEAITLAGSANQVRQEVQELRRLAAEAHAVVRPSANSKTMTASSTPIRLKSMLPTRRAVQVRD
jgi:hypothetical protein